MWIAKNNDIIILAKDTREELEQALQFMVYTSIENSDLDYTLHNGKYITKEELTTLKKEQFNKDFFKTSLGYIRRKVSMATGETKDFLSDLLPSISIFQTNLDDIIVKNNIKKYILLYLVFY